MGDEKTRADALPAYDIPRTLMTEMKWCPGDDSNVRPSA